MTIKSDDHQNHQDHPISKWSRARFLPGPLQCCCACWLWAVGCWLWAVGCLLAVVAVVAVVAGVALVVVVVVVVLVVAVVAAVAAVVAVAAAVSAYLLLVLVALLVLGLMRCCKGSFNMKEWLSGVFTTAGLGQLNLFSSTLGMV